MTTLLLMLLLCRRFLLSLLWVYQFLLFWIDGVSGHPLTDWGRWLPVVTGALCWTWLSAWLERHAMRH